jgi:pseudouridine-5'-phosphate glycosidase
MDAKGIKGKQATPFLLGRIVEITGGESLRANIALVKNNARLGAQIAVEYAKAVAGG